MHRKILHQEAIRVYEKLKKPTDKYPEVQSIKEIMEFYSSVFEVIEKRGHKNVLDFGCGLGMSQLVYNLKKWNFKLTLGDSNVSWYKNEMKLFNHTLKRLKISPLRFTDVLSDDFCFIDKPEGKFDCVVTIRFPPVSRLKITPNNFKKKLQPYCIENFEYIYLHKSLQALNRHNFPNEAENLMADTSHKLEISNPENMIRIY